MNTTETEIDQLRSDMQKLRGDIEALGSTIGRIANAGVREVHENICGAKKGFGMDIRDRAEHFTQSLEQNPVSTALAAFGVGMLLGRLCSGRSRKG